MREEGAEIPRGISYDEMKEFHEKGEYSVELNQNWVLKTMLEMHDFILPWLDQRDWSIAYVNPGDGEFICSDRPVMLNWTTETPPWHPPGLAHKDAELKIPLDKNTCLLSRFDMDSFEMPVGSRFVAALNGMVAMQSDERIFSPSSDFSWMRSDSSICGLKEWLALVKKRHSKDRP